jgi:tetratricopeptide (TPR) repeat protein
VEHRTGSASDPFEPQPGIDPKPTKDLEKNASEKEVLDQALAAFLKVKKTLEEKGVAQWGGEEYDEMATLSREADTLFMDNLFLAAAEKYAQAERKAAVLADKAGAVFQRLLEEGEKALEAGDTITARQKLRVALMIEPSNGPAQESLERADKLDGVRRLIESGKNHEKNNRFAFAHADFQEALKLDPESEDAQKGLNRVNEWIVGEQVQKLMSEGLTAYHNGDYRSARTRLLKAKAFRPDSREVQNALVQVDAAIQLAKIEKLQRNAKTAEKTEDWEQALKSYLAVLEIDPKIGFAVEGKDRALEHIRVAKRVGFFLQNSDAMESSQQLRNAMQVIEAAETLQPKGPHFRAQLDELKMIVDAARTPVKVMIESDDLTEVVVYKVGKLGRFSFRELSLRPGTYTVVGSRNGYKDVRQKIIVKPGQKTLRVTVICRNKV